MAVAMTGILQGLGNALSQHITYMQQKKLQDEDRAFRQAMAREGFTHQAAEGERARTHSAEQARLGRELTVSEGQKTRVHSAEESRLDREQRAEQGRLGREHTSTEADKTRTHQAEQGRLGREHSAEQGRLGREHTSTEADKTRTHQAEQGRLGREHTSTENQLNRAQTQKQHAERMALQQSYYKLNEQRIKLQMERDPLERQKIQAQIDHLNALIKSIETPKTAAFQSMRPEVRTAATDLAYGLGQSITSKVYKNEAERKQALQYEGALIYQRLLQITGGNVVEAQRALAAIWEHTAATEEMRNYAGRIERDPTRRSQLLHIMGNEFLGGLTGSGMDLNAAQAQIDQITTDYNKRKSAETEKTPEQKALEAQSLIYGIGLTAPF